MYAGPEVDCWSAGVILYALLCGTLPFDDDLIHKLFKKIKSGQYVIPSHVSDLARSLITQMLTVDPTRRITVNEILQHPWFKYRLPPYLAVSPAVRVAAQKRAEAELDDEAVDEMLALDEFRELRQHRPLIVEWIKAAAAHSHQLASGAMSKQASVQGRGVPGALSGSKRGGAAVEASPIPLSLS